MDDSMTEGTLEKESQGMDSTDLIKIVRSLDQNGPGANGENLQLLWRGLTASAEDQFHAAEESSLRWILKSMNGSSPNAETLRRYPLSWTILSCVFQRIPLFSLAKSLADRRFISVLQQTLKEVSQPEVVLDESTGSTKRKRSNALAYKLEELKSQQACIASGQAIFHALKCLLDRLNVPASLSSHDKIGAEHIISLFCTSASEAVVTARSLLAICRLFLNADDREDIEGWEHWVQVVAKVWDLHLQGDDDVLNVATHLFTPSAILLSRLEKLSQGHHEEDESLRARWSPDLQRLMHRSLIFPARAAFLSDGDLSSINTALEVSRSLEEISAPALYYLAAGASKSITRRDLQRSNAAWMEQIFHVIQENTRKRDDRNALIRGVLSQAVDNSMSVGTEDLRVIARECGLQKKTDWDILAMAGKSDPAIFYASGDENELLEEICTRSIGKTSDAEYVSMSTVVEAIMKAFRTGRDFAGFLKLWFRQMCRVSQKKSSSARVWLDIGRQHSKIESLDSQIEKELSAQQLLEVLQWAEDQEADPQTICLFSDTLAKGTRSEAFVDAMGRRLFDYVERVDDSSSASTALKWSVVARTISWIHPDERSEVWSAVKNALSKILEKSSIKSAETFEAFKCCCQAWVSMGPDGAQFGEAGDLVEKFTTRLSAEIDAKGAKDLHLLDIDDKYEYHEHTAYQAYLAWYLRGSSRLVRLHSERKPGLISPAEQALANKASTLELTTIWTALLNNEVNMNDSKLAKHLIDHLINTLEKQSKRMLNEQGQLCMRSLIRINLDAFSRQQRERIAALLDQGRPSKAKSKKRISSEDWKLLLSLTTKMMSRPTFHESMSFSNLTEIAESLSGCLTDMADREEMLNLIERFSSLASVTLRQMTDHIEERSITYLNKSSALVSLCEGRLAEGSAREIPPPYITLLKALAVEMRRSPSCQNHPELAALLESVEQTLERCVSSMIGEFMDKKVFDKPTADADLALFTVVDVSTSASRLVKCPEVKQSTVRKLEKRSRESMQAQEVKGWKMQIFLRTHLTSDLENPCPTTIDSLVSLPVELREILLHQYVASITRSMDSLQQLQFLRELVREFSGCDTDGQIRAIQQVVDQLMELPEIPAKAVVHDFAEVHYDLVVALSSVPVTPHFARLCQVLYTMLERKPQAMGQWNVEITLSTICDLCGSNAESARTASFSWRCKLVEIIIKKHRLRLEGHFHLLMTTLQALLRSLITDTCTLASGNKNYLERMAHSFGRLITLVCEPTAGAVARSRQQGALDTATDAAKRSAGRHMYLVLMQYVKLQLESNVPVEVGTALEPAMNSIFDITPPEGRKILNDAMDGSGRAILREMFQRYTKFGKWSGV